MGIQYETGIAITEEGLSKLKSFILPEMEQVSEVFEFEGSKLFYFESSKLNLESDFLWLTNISEEDYRAVSVCLDYAETDPDEFGRWYDNPFNLGTIQIHRLDFSR